MSQPSNKAGTGTSIKLCNEDCKLSKSRTSKNSGQNRNSAPASAGDLIKAYRPALLVYAALRELAGTKKQYNCVRKTIREYTGISAKTVSKAMKALQDCGWIKLTYGTLPSQNRKWYRITFAFGSFLPTVTSKAKSGKRQSPKATKTAPSGAANKPAASTSKAQVPQGKHAAPSDLAQEVKDALRELSEKIAPELLQMSSSVASLEPSNDLKGSVPLDPSDGPYSLERVGVTPCPTPTLRSGGDDVVPPDVQGSKIRDEESDLIPTPEDQSASDELDELSPLLAANDAQMGVSSSTCNEILAAMGLEPGSDEDVAADDVEEAV